MIQAQSAFDLLIDFISNPGCSSSDDTSTVHIEPDIKCLRLCRIVIDLLLLKAVDVGIVDSYYEFALRLGLKVDPHFYEGVKGTQGNRKRKERVTWVFSLARANNVLSNLELCKLCVEVHKHRSTDVLTITQEAELGGPKSLVKIL